MNKKSLSTLVQIKWIQKLGIACIILVTIINIAMLFFDNEINFIIKVKPKTESIIAKYPNSEVLSSGTLIIKNPTIIDKLLFRTDNTPSLITSIFYFLILIILYKNSGNINFHEPEFFRKNVWKPILYIGLLILLWFYINMAIDLVIKKHVVNITNYEYKVDEKFTHLIQFWGGMLLLIFSTVIKKGFHLQQEQDLTV